MIGQTISHHRILEKLDGGGLGVVYRLILLEAILLLSLPGRGAPQSLDWVQEMRRGNMSYQAKEYRAAEEHLLLATKLVESHAANGERLAVSLYSRVDLYCAQENPAKAARNIATDETALSELEKTGYKATPVTMIDGVVVVGFDLTKLRTLLQLGG